MASYIFLTEDILWNVNDIFCMFISIIHSFHILSWLLRRVWLRKRVVQFLQDHRGLRDDWKSFTVKHFEAEEVFRSTTSNIINKYLRHTPHKLQLKSRTGPKVSLKQRCFYGLQYQRMEFRALLYLLVKLG